MRVRRFATHVEVLCPAKLNLFLEVLGKRPDGFHELETLMVAVDLHDCVTFRPVDEPGIKLECRWGMGLAASEQGRGPPQQPAHELLHGAIPSGEENLVVRAALLLREQAGVCGGAVIGLVKRVPAAAGLGGASSDAAATLVAANEAWRLGWSRERLAEVAGQLGSDVPFFLSEGAALCRGRGERMEALTAGRLSVVIVRPPVGLSTPRVYSVCRPSATASGAAALQASLARGDAAGVARYLKNDLMAPASSLTPWIGILRDEFDKQDVLGHQMSGSGSSYFGICRSNRQARRIAARLRARGMGMVVAARTIAVSSDAFQPQA